MHAIIVTVVHVEAHLPKQVECRSYGAVENDHRQAHKSACASVRLIYAHFAHRCNINTLAEFHRTYLKQLGDNPDIHEFAHTVNKLPGFTVNIQEFTVK